MLGGTVASGVKAIGFWANPETHEMTDSTTD